MNEQNETAALPLAAPKPYETVINGVPVIVHPNDWNVSDFENCLDYPVLVRETIDLTDLQSFIAYVVRHKEEGSTIIKLQDTTAVAVIDYHLPPDEANVNMARWGSHLACFSTRATSAWAAWTTRNGKLSPQSEFADFIYQNLAEVVDPVGADLLEIIQTLKATAKGEFRDMKDLNSGSIELVYRLKVSAQGGTSDRPLSLPERFKIRVTPFYGGQQIELNADLVLRAPKSDGDPLLMGFRIYRLDDELEDLSQRLETEISEKTGVPVFRCK